MASSERPKKEIADMTCAEIAEELRQLEALITPQDEAAFPDTGRPLPPGSVNRLPFPDRDTHERYSALGLAFSSRGC